MTYRAFNEDNASLMPIWDLTQIRDVERSGLAMGLPLMHRAGAAAADFVKRMCHQEDPILVLAGPGNNGGDALVAAYLLKQAGRQVTVVLPCAPTNSSRDAQQALSQWQSLSTSALESTLPKATPALIIDGLFGIGLNRQLAAPWQVMIDQANEWQRPILSLDIPSGLSAQTGEAHGRPIRATWTMSFIARCSGVSAVQARPYVGHLYVEDLDLNIGHGHDHASSD